MLVFLAVRVGARGAQSLQQALPSLGGGTVQPDLVGYPPVSAGS